MKKNILFFVFIVSVSFCMQKATKDQLPQEKMPNSPRVSDSIKAPEPRHRGPHGQESHVDHEVLPEGTESIMDYGVEITPEEEEYSFWD